MQLLLTRCKVNSKIALTKRKGNIAKLIPRRKKNEGTNTMRAEDNNLKLIESELKFISRHVQTIEGAGGSDFEAVDEICLAVNSALRALAEYKLSLQPDAEAIAA
jgi:hypothetical protein